jgi:hypothetical protein
MAGSSDVASNDGIRIYIVICRKGGLEVVVAEFQVLPQYLAGWPRHDNDKYQHS